MGPAAPKSLDLEDAFHFDGGAQRQGRCADCRSGVSAGIAEDLDQKVGGAVDDLRRVLEIGRTGDKAEKLDGAHDTVQVAVTGIAQLGNQIKPAKAGCLIAFFNAEGVAEMTDKLGLSVGKRGLPGNEHQISRDDEGNIIGDGCRALRQFNSEFGEARLNFS